MPFVGGKQVNQYETTVMGLRFKNQQGRTWKSQDGQDMIGLLRWKLK